MLIYQRVSPLKKITGLIYHKRTRSTYTVYLFSPTLHTQGSETHTNATNETQGAWFHPGFGHLPTSAHDGAAVIVRLVRDCKIEVILRHSTAAWMTSGRQPEVHRRAQHLIFYPGTTQYRLCSDCFRGKS